MEQLFVGILMGFVLGKGAYKWSNEDITELLLALSSSLNKDLKEMKCDCKCNCQK